MINRLNKTALLIFTRSLSEEVKFKKFTPFDSRKLNKKVVGLLISHTIQTAQKTNYPVFVISSDQQIGNTFGERYANAFENIFKMGYERVISLGNDSPTLTKKDVISAADEIQKSDVVIGPAKDGGAYLIALTSVSYKRDEFINLRWNSEFVLYDLKKYSKNFSYTLIETREDIDDSSDLLKICSKYFSYNDLCTKIFNIVKSFSNYSKVQNSNLILQFLGFSSHLRAPPLYC
ncbi:DUF2064 domain-containing protein [Ignavibacterium sp.]|uniref:TIGR04282 family arsenosugar biosynthesis glycosyltransferase n=1 Tax=Ignavibacterium sp. TaxID=2651167 RepID=UPI00307F9079